MSTTPPMPPQPPPASPPPSGGEQPLSQSDERLWAALAQVSGILISFIGPLLVLLIFGPRSAFVKKESTEALNFQITVAIAYVIGFVLTLVVVGIFIVMAVWVVSLVFMILAALKNKDGVDYRYPVCIRFIK